MRTNKYKEIITSALIIFSTSINANTQTTINKNWVLESTVDPMNDQYSLVAYTISKKRSERMVVRCTSKETIDIYINWGTYITKSDTHDLELRFDKHESNHYLTNPSNDGKSQFINQWFNSYSSLVEKLKSSYVLMAKVIPYGGNALYANFSLAGASESINSVINKCGRLPVQKHDYWRYKS